MPNFYFYQRVVRLWNALGAQKRDFSSICGVKNYLNYTADLSKRVSVYSVCLLYEFTAISDMPISVFFCNPWYIVSAYTSSCFKIIMFLNCELL